MKKIEFRYDRGIVGCETITKICFYDDDITEEEIQEDFEEWLFDKIYDFGWEEISDKK